MKVMMIAAVLLAAGCANPQMTAEQLNATAKDKNASVACATGTGPWGKVNTVYANVDKAAVKNGQVVVDSECKVTIVTQETMK